MCFKIIQNFRFIILKLAVNDLAEDFFFGEMNFSAVKAELFEPLAADFQLSETETFIILKYA